MRALTEVPVAATSPEPFRDLIGPDYESVAEAVDTAHRLLEGRVIWHLNSTAHGGGVAEMLQSLLAYARGAGADVRWLTIGGDAEFFRVTKRIHNHLHESPGDGGELGKRERAIYERALMESADELVEIVRAGDIVYLHDPQTAGLVPHVKSREVHVVWRCHVGVDRPGEFARSGWEFLRRYIEDADAYVFSRREFVWDGLEQDRLWIVPPSIDAFSAKNQELDPEAVSSILATIGLSAGDGKAPVFRRHDGSTARVDRAADLDQDGLLPAEAPMIAQVSRWDRLKDPEGVLRAFAEHCTHPGAHLVLAGPAVAAVTDDPEGAEVLADVRAMRAGLPEDVRSRVHLVSLPMDDVEENAAMVNAIQRRADVVVQKSLAEGFGLTVAEAMWKARPVVSTAVGGIQDQVDGESGILIEDPTDLRAFGAAIDGLLADPDRAAAIGAAARERVRESFLGSRHLVQYMELIGLMLADQPEGAGKP
ncbi:MAG: glycosyltransferase [Solirubrobacterales bacterium]